MFAWHVHSCCRVNAEDLRQAIALGAEDKSLRVQSLIQRSRVIRK